jgi:calcineurin-like phosphoesterase family protein
VIFDRPGLLLGDLSLQEITNDARRLLLTLDPGRHHLIVGGAHAVKL